MIHNESGKLIIEYVVFFERFWFFAIVLVVGMIIGYILGVKKCKDEKESRYGKRILALIKNALKWIYAVIKDNKMEDIVLVLSVLLVLFSIIFECMGIMGGIPNIVMNIFGSLILSWLVTKKSSKKELEEIEQNNAKKSRRYLNSIKTSAQNASMLIGEYLRDNTESLSKEAVLILQRAKDQVEHIKIGIDTSIIDWEDMMALEDISAAHASENVDKRKIKEAAEVVPCFNIQQFAQDDLNQNEA